MADPQPGQRLVFGATGYIGSHLVPRLLAEGLPVRACGRNLSTLESRQWSGVELCVADALEPESLDAALADIEIAYYLVHSMAAGRNFGELDLAAADNFQQAAAAAGVRQIIYLGGLVPLKASSEHIVSRRDTGEALRRGQVPVIELRAGIIVGPGSAAFEVMRDLVFHLPIMITPRWVRARSQPISLEDLLRTLVELPDHCPDSAIFDIAGDETLSYQDMMTTLAEVAGHRPPLIIPVPVLSPRLSSYWLRLVTSVPYNIARALIEGLKHDFEADDTPLRSLLPGPRQSFREAVAQAFETEANQALVSRWSEGAFAVRHQRRDYAYYAKQASGSALSRAPAAALWRVITSIGGTTRYFYLNPLWTLREVLDWSVGGPGLNHQRRHPIELRVGDRIDSWSVIGIEPQSRLSLAFGMRAPGAGMLELTLTPSTDGQTRVTATAYWHPAGVWGLLYWYALAPAHLIIFKGMTREICARAEASSPEPTLT
jgi:uncharacterized protein YbjT (DUF2867 family)/uncharacterized protein YndB with AHSA1/START domain